MSASTSTSSRSQSFGSATNENVYLIDGTDFTAPLTGAAWPWPNTDAIEEIQVLSLGAPADYGNLGGAVFNVVTRQGSNTFHGDANFYFQTQGLTGRNTTDAQDNKQPYHRDEFKDTTVQVGGPVMKDKLWFFGSFQYQKDADSQPGTDPAFPARSSAKRYFWKVNYQLNDENRFQVQTHDDFYRIPGRATANTAPSTLGVENGHNPSPGVLWTSVINSTTVLEARYSGFYGVDHGDPLNGGPRVARRFNDLDTGQITGGIYSWYDGKSSKTAFSGKVTKYADKFMGGSHDFKLGVQYNSGLGEYTYGLNDYIYTYGAIPAYGYTQLPFTQGGRLKSFGIFADDAYQLGRATIESGSPLRQQQGLLRRAESPRRQRQSDRRAVQGGGRPLQLARRLATARRQLQGDRERLDAPQSALRTLLPWHRHRGVRQHHTVHHAEICVLGTLQPIRRAAGQGTGLRQLQTVGRPQLEEPVHRSVHPGLRAAGRGKPRDRGELRLQTQRGPNGFPRHRRHLSARALHRSGRCDRAAGVPTDEWRQFTAIPAKERRPHVRAVHGVEFDLKKRMSKHWQANFGLTLSKATGRQGGGSARSTPLSSQISTASIFGQNPNDYINSDGRLVGDRPVVLKTQFIYQWSWGIMTSFNFQSQSGKPIYSEIRAATSATGIPGATRIIAVTSDGQDRTKLWQTLDARVEKSFKLGKTPEAAVFGDFLNLFNSDANESVLDRRLGNSNYLVPSRFILPRRLMLGAKFRF